ncbi:hypothetical protein OSTOST_18235, partial [Ostertagia ostertagi]
MALFTSERDKRLGMKYSSVSYVDVMVRLPLYVALVRVALSCCCTNVTGGTNTVTATVVSLLNWNATKRYVYEDAYARIINSQLSRFGTVENFQSQDVGGKYGITF